MNNFIPAINLFVRFTQPILIALIIGIGLSACDNGDQKNLSVQKSALKYTENTVLKGKVSHKNKSIASGEVKASDSLGRIVATTQLEKGGKYTIEIPAKTELPIILSFYPGEDGSDVDKLVTVVIYTTIKKYDINDLTTLIAKNAKALGGYTHGNMTIAADSTVGVPDANKTSTGFRGDPTKQYGGWH